METKDGSFGFDFDATYTEIKEKETFTYGFSERFVTVTFNEQNAATEVKITFDPETELH